MASDTTKYVFAFEEGDGKDKKLLGGKGANLCEMTQIGLNVPAGFVISTAACLEYLSAADRKLPPGLLARSMRRCGPLRRRPARVSATRRIHCWSRCAPARPCPCPG